MNAATTSNGVVKFQTNIPEFIALEFSQGRNVQSQYGGDQVMFSLTDGRKMYLPPFVAEKIYAAGVSARVPFAICKREVVHGNRRTVEYQVDTQNGNLAGTAGTPVKDAPATPAAVQRTSVNGQTHSSPGAVGRAVPISNPTAPVTHDSYLAGMIEAHLRAIDVAVAAETYASQQGLAIRYSAEDIRTIAATIFIQRSKDGRV